MFFILQVVNHFIVRYLYLLHLYFNVDKSLLMEVSIISISERGL